MKLASKAIFSKRQAWIPEFVGLVLTRFPDRPRVSQLIKSFSDDPYLRNVVKVKYLKTARLKKILDGRSLASLDWDLPRFESARQLGQHLGITASALDWLAALDGPPERRPAHYVCTWIKKRSFGFRLIESPKLILKSVQRIVLDDIVASVPVHQSAHGFCKSRNVLSFVNNHVGKSFCLRMDLKDFFPSISARRIFGFFRSAGMPKDVARLLTGICTTQTNVEIVEQIRPPGCRGAFEASRLYLPPHLPQGAPTSGALANQLAFGLDCRLTGLAKKTGVHYTRYADDLLFSGDRMFAKTASRFSTLVAAIAIEEGFQVHFRKTRFQYSSQCQKAAGVVLNEKTNFSRRKYDRLKAVLHNCARHGPESQNHESIGNFRLHLAGKVDWVKQLNAARGQQLARLFDQIDWSESTGQ